jgi:hypothetical protein
MERYLEMDDWARRGIFCGASICFADDVVNSRSSRRGVCHFDFAGVFLRRFLGAMSRALDFVELRVRAAVDGTRRIIAHSFHHLPACADLRQGLFLLLPTLANGIGRRGIQSLKRLFRVLRAKFVQYKLKPEQ